MSPMELAYRKTVTAGTSGLGLLIALYDTLAGDLRRAAEAERSNDIEKRCREVNHALRVIGFLEDQVRRGSGGELADQLTWIYRSLRRKLVEAQAKRSAELIERQMAKVLEIRAQWQSIEFSCEPSGPEEILPPVKTQTYPVPVAAPMQQRQLSWSA
jgi:flagellar secretion chaperone FliS